VRVDHGAKRVARPDPGQDVGAGAGVARPGGVGGQGGKGVGVKVQGHAPAVNRNFVSAIKPVLGPAEHRQAPSFC